MRLVLTTTILICHFITAHSQEFVNNSASWTYGYFNIGIQSCVELSYEQDTLINTRLYKQYGKDYYNVVHSVLGEREDFSGSPEFMREEGDSIFYLNSSTNVEVLLYNFSATVGDSWNMALPVDITGHEVMNSKVVNIGMTVINNEELKWQHVEYNIGNEFFYNDTVYHRFGPNSMSILPWDEYYSQVDRNQLGGLIRYVADTFEYWKGITGCERISSSLEIGNNSDVTLFPNPTQSTILVKNLNPNVDYKATVYNINGKVVLKTDSPFEIDCSGLYPGIYFLQIMDSTNKYNLRMVKL